MTTYPSILHEFVTTSPSLRPRSKQIYLHDVERFVAFAGTEPSGWTLAKTRAFYQHLLAQGMKPQSANRIMRTVAFVAKWYATEVGRPEADFSKIQLASDGETEPKNALTDEQARALLDTCGKREPKDVRDFALMVTALETGMRRMSLAGMTWEAFRPHAIEVPIKGYDKPYLVPLSDAAMTALDLWRTYLTTHRVPKKGPVFRALTSNLGGVTVGTGISTTSVYNIIHDRATAVGLEVHPHLFRHTFITWRRMAGVSDAHIAAISAHRLPGDNSGQLYRYTDKKLLAEQARKHTPAWLSVYVEKFCAGERP